MTARIIVGQSRLTDRCRFRHAAKFAWIAFASASGGERRGGATVYTPPSGAGVRMNEPPSSSNGWSLKSCP